MSQPAHSSMPTARSGAALNRLAGPVGAVDGLAERHAFVKAMRSVASSVTVVTTDGQAGRHGATVSAFCSVSADPPSALVCLKADSRTALAVACNQTFCVNVLPQARADIAERFAGRDDARVGDRFDGIDHDIQGGWPMIAGATAFLCRLQECLDFGSHGIFVGNVTAVRQGAPAPLAYLDGAYHKVVPHHPAPVA